MENIKRIYVKFITAGIASQFEDMINELLEEMQIESGDLVDIKYTSDDDYFSALIIYRL